jgi:hypothetical protein
VTRYLSGIPTPPNWIAAGPSGAEFVEAADAVISSRQMAEKADAKLNIAGRSCQFSARFYKFSVSKRCYSLAPVLSTRWSQNMQTIPRIGAADSMPMQQTRRLSVITTCAAAIFVVSVCAAPVAMAAPASAPIPAQIAVPATVQGFMPGYTDNGLTHLVSACVGEAPGPEMAASAGLAPWHVQVDVSNIYAPRATTVVRATLLEGDHEVASKWLQTAGLNTAPQASFCRVVSGLTQQLWTSETRIASRNVAAG